MLNCVFDCNYLLYKNVASLVKNNCLYGDFHKAMTLNIKKYVNLFPMAKIWLVFDSRKKSWRKGIIDHYKAHRVKDPNIDWDWIFAELEIWKDLTQSEENWTILQGDEIEGDDWIMSIVKMNNKKEQSNIIIASDGDLKQLLGWKDNLWINIQISDINGKEKIYLPQGHQIYLGQLESKANDDPFNLSRMDMPWHDLLIELISKWEWIEIDPNEILFTKIIKGDKGDNIESVYKKVLKTGKMQGIGDAGAHKIWTLYNDMHGAISKINTKDSKMYDQIIDLIELNGKHSFTNQIKESIKKKLEMNVSLIELNWRHYPQRILDKIVEKLENLE